MLPGASRQPGWDDALGIARAQLKVTPVKDSRIVQISTESTSPQVAADYVNTVVSEFISQSQDDRWTLYQSTTAWLTRAQQDLKAQLEESERQLLAYAAESGLVGTSKDDNIVEQKLVQLQAEASRAQADRIAKESSYRTAMAQPADSLATALDNVPSDTKLTDLRRELADLNTTLTPEHPRVRRLQAQIAAMESSKQSEGTALLGRLRRDYESALYRERQLVADLNTQSTALSSQDKKLIRYKMLQREVDTLSRPLRHDAAERQGGERGVRASPGQRQDGRLRATSKAALQAVPAHESRPRAAGGPRPRGRARALPRSDRRQHSRPGFYSRLSESAGTGSHPLRSLGAGPAGAVHAEGVESIAECRALTPASGRSRPAR